MVLLRDKAFFRCPIPVSLLHYYASSSASGHARVTLGGNSSPSPWRRQTPEQTCSRNAHYHRSHPTASHAAGLWGERRGCSRRWRARPRGTHGWRHWPHRLRWWRRWRLFPWSLMEEGKQELSMWILTHSKAAVLLSHHWQETQVAAQLNNPFPLSLTHTYAHTNTQLTAPHPTWTNNRQ